VNKKKQKNFNFLAVEATHCPDPPVKQKFFGSFSKKEPLAVLPGAF
jgi:hypothetical protein